jgi:gliding motility-associated-like protein
MNIQLGFSSRVAKLLFLVGGLFLTTSSLWSQTIAPPTFLCVRNDTLIWLPAGNPCGAFNSYDIYSGPTSVGPFSLLASVTNQSQSTYYNPVPFGQTLYYYILSNHNCPGFIAAPSAILDNQLPLSPVILATTVTSPNSVQINWDLSPSPETQGYIIYHETSIGLVPIDTVFGVTQFTDFNSTPGDEVEKYTVVALDACGNAGLFNPSHETMFLETEVNVCERVLELTWSPYIGWLNGIGEQVIWGSINNGPWSALDTVAGDVFSVDIPALGSGLYYCFRVIAKETGGVLPSRSNEVCITSTIVEPVDELILQYATILPNALTELYWNVNSNAAVISMIMQRFNEESQDWDNIIGTPITDPLPIDHYETANVLNLNQSSFNYRILSTDACGDQVASNETRTILLKGVPTNENINTVVWSEYDNTLGICQQYNLYRQLGNQTTLIGTFPNTVFEYSDQVDASLPSFYRACYWIVADAEVLQPSGFSLPVESRSNTVCIEQIARIYAPTAFAPRGINQFFKPLILFPQVVKNYQVLIYDRWGREVFTSTDIDSSWDGKVNGMDAAAGLYTFYIQLEQLDGRVAELRDNLVLIR